MTRPALWSKRSCSHYTGTTDTIIRFDQGVHVFETYQGPDGQLCLEQGIIETQQQAAIDHVVHELLSVLAEAEAVNPVTYVIHCSQEV